MQRQEQQQLQTQQLTQDMVRRLPILEADRTAIAFQLGRLARRNPCIATGSGAVEWVADTASGFEERLFEQIEEGSGTEAQRALQKRLVLALDHRGLLPESDFVLAHRFEVDVADIEAARQALLFLEPTGIGAKNERDCQYRHAIEHDDPLVLDVFEALDANLDDIPGRLDISVAEYERATRIVATLPKTPLLYEGTEPVVPELEVVRRDGELVTTWFSPTLDAARVGDDREAKWWHETLEMRNATLKSVWAVIAERQRDWLDGKLVLHPLTRKEVAEQIGKHESTVGRAIQGKYVTTEGGVMAWRHFFVRATHGQSPFMVKKALAELIQQETSPLSDAALMRELDRLGYTVTRRTVANYREALGFGNSRERERQLWKGGD
ncbi:MULTISPECIES: Fis family transcriptional regulator [Exiguobacterium]|jgi:RNA polymerase sigma-54 factor|uniref:RNA polymerase factor sigma-54 n=1 Tax=Exiguobacterium TaxID=33986 RepID=UPI0004977341|nr:MULTISPECIES: Fis family transcriptional regulator [Exiguobacterium]TCI68596.1 Fis family transcriptional regulator [Exiguobacterium sp. IPCI3]TCI78260.1 Fis family transcriptional regulator [Exiguobacterium sp. IPCH1]TCI79401.1 Fis family transcriptional regulator [Exiguobacterium sp. IPBC4]